MTRPTIRDVAARAGVSKSLVSLVLRDAPHVSPAKRAAVQAAIAELGYRPNAVARSLVSRRTGVLGIVIADHHNPFFADVIDGVDERAAAAGYAAVIRPSGGSAAREGAAVDKFLELRVDGLVMAGSSLPANRIAAVAAIVPVVLVTRSSRSPAVDTVLNDDGHGARLAVEHLIGLGHRRIAHIDGGRAPGGPARRKSYERTMRAHRLARQMNVAGGAFTQEGGAKAIRSLLATATPPTAVFACNDVAALGALGAMREAGLAAPRDISIVGYDNSSLAALPQSLLTTVDQPRMAMGRQAVELVLERLDGRTGVRRVVLEPGLIVRSTTGPPPG